MRVEQMKSPKGKHPRSNADRKKIKRPNHKHHAAEHVVTTTKENQDTITKVTSTENESIWR